MMISDTLPTIPVGAGSFVDVKDVARGCILAAERGQVGENYILGGTNLNFEQFIDQVAAGFGIDVTRRKKPQALIRLVAKIKAAMGYLSGNEPDLTPESLQIISHQYSCSSQKAKDILGYHITPFENTLGDIREYLTQRKTRR